MKSLYLKTASAAALAAVFSIALQAADAPAPAAKDAAKPAAEKAAVPAAPKQITLEEFFSALPDPVAEIGGQKVAKKDFLADIRPYVPAAALASVPQNDVKTVIKKMVEGYVDKTVSLKLLEKDGFKPSPELVKADLDATLKKLSPAEAEQFKKYLEAQGKKIEDIPNDKGAQEEAAFNKWLDAKIVPLVKVGDAEIEKYYRDNQDKFKTQETVKVSHILIMPKIDPKAEASTDPAVKKKAADEADAAAKQKASDILAKLKQGADFGELAEKNSDCPSGKSKKGALDEFSRNGEMDKDFEDAAFKLQPGQMSDLVKTQFGYHIIKLAEKKPAGFVGLDNEKVKGFIKDSLTNDGVTKALQSALQKEKDALKVKINI